MTLIEIVEELVRWADRHGVDDPCWQRARDFVAHHQCFGSGKQRSIPTRLPLDFKPSDETIAWAMEHVPHVPLTTELDEFRAWWTARDARRADWQLAFRNWLRKAARIREVTTSGHRYKIQKAMDRLQRRLSP